MHVNVLFVFAKWATNVSAYYDWVQSIIKDPAPATNCKMGLLRIVLPMDENSKFFMVRNQKKVASMTVLS